MMSTAAEARTLVSFAKFPPEKGTILTPGSIAGVRGVGSPFASAGFGQNAADYIATANKNIFIAVQIETVEGLNNCEEIAKVEGIGKLSPISVRSDRFVARYAVRRVSLIKDSKLT